MTAAQAAALSQHVTDHVIVVLRAQPAATASPGTAAESRSRAIDATQAPLIAELHQTAATSVHTYSLVNALSATVSPGEATRLAANPAVAEVIPDSLVRGPDVATQGGAAGHVTSARQSRTGRSRRRPSRRL